MYGIAWWFCCLNPLERTALRQTALALPATSFLGVPLDIWDAFWLGAGGGMDARRDAFLTVYQLEIVTIDEGEPPVPVEVVRPVDLPLWVSWSLYVLTSASLCPDGCEQSKPPYAT